MASSERSESTAISEAHGCFVFGVFRVDVDRRRLWQGDRAIDLPSRAFDCLAYLIAHRGRIVGKTELIESIWHDVAVTDDSLVNVVSVLRRALGDDRRNARYILTVPRRGYRFIESVTVDVQPLDGKRPPDGAPALGSTTPSGGTTVADTGPQRSVAHRGARAAWLGLGAAGGIVVGLLVYVAFAARHEPILPLPEPPGGAIRFTQTPPPGTRIVSGGALSPDGRYLAFVARDVEQGSSALWVRVLASGELRKLAGTDAASKPFWAPDARRLAFFASGQLFSTGFAAEQPRPIARVDLAPAGGSWGPDDTILFATWSGGIFAVPASGEAPARAVIEIDRAAADISMSWPQMLPDGRHFLYHRVNLDAARTGTFVGDLLTQESHRLLYTEHPASYAPSNHLLHVRDDLLVAEEIDIERLEPTGRAEIVARGVAAPSLDADDMVSAAGNLLAYPEGSRHQNLSWLNRRGKPILGLAMPTVVYNPRLSPDQTQLLATGSITTDPGLWLASTSREEYARLEPDAIAPLWAPDGRRIAYSARGGFDLIIRAMDNRAEKRRLLSDSSVKILNDWSPDGEEIVFTRNGGVTGLDLWAAGTATGEAHLLLATPASEMQLRFAPDGHWIAYASDESGTLEVYVQRYPSLSEKRRVSADGGGQPQWRADQRELFYLSADRSLMSVTLEPTASGVEFATPRPLFPAPLSGDAGDARDHYLASTDGSQFLVDGTGQDGADRGIAVLVNWAGDGEARQDPALHFDALPPETR